MTEELSAREILNYVYSCDVESDEKDKNRIINQALTQLNQCYVREFKEMLLKIKREKNCTENCIDCVLHIGCQIDIHNQALNDIRKKLEEWR